MEKRFLPEAEKYTTAHKRRIRNYKIITFLAVLVVLCTSYALMRPAITMERCLIPEHEHNVSCYEQITSESKTVPICDIQSTIHSHNEDCYDKEGNLICTQADYLLHTHDDNCYDENGDLWCTLAEIEEAEDGISAERHQHDESCFETIEEPIDTEILTCTNDAPEHEHTALCYGTWVLTCDKEEHTHTEACLNNSEQNNQDNNNNNSNKEEITDDENKDDSAKDDEKQEIAKDEQELPQAVIHVIALIDELPSVEEIDAQFTAYEEAEDEEGLGAYYQELEYQVRSAYEQYEELTPEEQEQVTNRDTLLELVKFFSVDTFAIAAVEKPYRDNSSKLHKVAAKSTRDFIEVNLYDYGSGSTGRNINDKYNNNKNLPGFQQNGGTSDIASLNAFKTTWNMNFGDNITADLADIKLITDPSLNPVGINVVKDSANSPISRYSQVMYPTLINGYPAIADGNSLGYLFGTESYSKKMNTQSIDGLFQYDEETGAYHFNSRENFAEFNAEDDTFTLYKEIFTPNFIMYPFGNFMPFNDIVYDAKQVSQIDENYFRELSAQAAYLYQNGKGEQYNTLAKVLEQFIKYAKEDGWGNNDFTAERILTHYFYWGSRGENAQLPSESDNENNFRQISLDNLYSLDYDVPSDFFFGMEMKMNFMQPKGGLTGKDGRQPMVFYFTGDDDVWVYIDGKLFLDLSGIHRHVGGEIDFVNGVVKYYRLDTKTGDVETTPYDTKTFAEILGSSEDLNEKGTFKDYSSHSFNFYYMERGSGSSVCRMNFNFPLLRQNSISVTKELSVDEEDKIGLLGDPDFHFQVLKENGDLFIGAGTGYDIMDQNGQQIGSGITDDDGIFTLKANQTAVFSGIKENAGKYFVRELLDENAFAQYGKISVDGESTTENYDVTVGSDTFKGVNSPLKDVSNGSTVFQFNNQITFNKLGSLEITKKLEHYPTKRSIERFDFLVELDGTPLPAGTIYTVNGKKRQVSEEGIITLKPDETAVITGIIADSKFKVKETVTSSAGYSASYTVNGDPQINNCAEGIIQNSATVKVLVNNEESGVSVDIPITKTLESPDGNEHSYTFKLEQIIDAEHPAPTDPAFTQEIKINVTTDPITDHFTIDYPYAKVADLPQKFYYKITENVIEGDEVTSYDETAYVIEVTISSDSGVLKGEITSVWRDGEKLAAIDDSTISFTNHLLRYELPETGGGGSTKCTIGGMLIMLTAGILLYKRRCEKRDVSSN